MISNQEIMELNKKMVSGITDGTGYQPSDYPKVATLSRLKTPLKDIETFVLLHILLNYRNNALVSPKWQELYNRYTEIRDRIKAYGNQNNKTDSELNQIIQNAAECKSHPYEDFIPYSLSFTGHNSHFIYLSLREFVPDIPAGRFGAHWEKNEKGKSVIVIPNNKIRAFIDYIRTAGKVGHVPSESLLKYIETINTADTNEQSKQSMPVRIYPITDKSEFNHDSYIITANNADLIRELWKKKDIAIKYVDSKQYNDKLIIYSTKQMLPELMSFCREHDIEIVTQPLVMQEPPKQQTYNNPVEVQQDQQITTISNNDTLPITPYPFQLEDANKILGMKRALLGHDMGCGKTIIMILVGMNINEPKIVICPESLRLNWKREIERMQPDAEVNIVYSKHLAVEKAKDWTILGYQTATKFKDQLNKGVYTLVVDEAHNIKSVDNYGKPASSRAAAVMDIAKKADRLFLLTGTPMPTRSKDLYNMLVMLGAIDANVPYAFHKYGLDFCRAFQTDYGWNYNGTSNREALHNILKRYMIRRLKRDVLPDLKKQRQFIPIAETNPEYRAIEKDIMTSEPGLTYLGKAMKGRRLLSRSKVKPAIDLAENYINSEESIVIVTEFQETLEKIASHFGNNACTICGEMTDKAKQKAIDDFQSGKKKVCVINVVAGGVGVTLTKAHNMIICDYDWTPSNMVQVEDRICRTGQTECCNIYYLYCEDALLDKAFISMITHKSENVDKVVDNSENTNDLETTKNNNKLYYEYLVAQIKKEKTAKKKKEKASK